MDEMYPVRPASAWCRGYLEAALEHLLLWADFVAPLKFHEDQAVVHTLRPAQALARAALESAAQAVWVMAPGAAVPCTRRHLTLVLHDLDEQRKAAPNEEREALKTARDSVIQEVAKVTSVTELLNAPSYLTLVREATSEALMKGTRTDMPTTVDEAERVWRASAGAMHGKRWPTIEQMTEMTDGDGRQIRAPRPEAITKVLKLAEGVLAYGVLRYADYLGHEGMIAAGLKSAFLDLAHKLPLLPGASVEQLLSAVNETSGNGMHQGGRR
jgi:hypothetical protein